MFSPEEFKRYQRHFSLPNFGDEGQRKLKESKVLVVGAGGLGSPVLHYLAAAGIGHIGILDHDTVEVSNLQRQVIHNSDDIGYSKIVSARDKIKRLNPNVQVEIYDLFLNRANALSIIESYDVIVDSTDNFPTRYLINDACVLKNRPFVYGSIYQYEGQVSTMNFKGGPNYRDLYPEPPAPEMVPNCAEGGVLGVLAGIIGTIQAAEVIKIISEIGEVLAGKLLIYDLLSAESRKIKFPKTFDNKQITELVDYEEFCGTNKTNINMVKEITVKELKKMQDNKEDFQLIDVREAYEYDIANLDGELIPLGDIPNAVDKVNKDKKVVVHCRSGKRSAQAIEYLQKKGDFDNLYNLKGGVLAWSDEIDPDMPKY